MGHKVAELCRRQEDARNWRPAEQVAGDVVRAVQAYLRRDGALGEHLTDQWLLPARTAVHATGRPAAFTCTMLSQHARTQVETIAAFLPVRFGTEKLDRAWRAR